MNQVTGNNVKKTQLAAKWQVMPDGRILISQRTVDDATIKHLTINT